MRNLIGPYLAAAMAIASTGSASQAHAADGDVMKCGVGYAYINKPLTPFAHTDVRVAMGLVISFSNEPPSIVKAKRPDGDVPAQFSYVINSAHMLNAAIDYIDVTEKVGKVFKASDLTPVLYHDVIADVFTASHIGNCGPADPSP